MGQIVPSGAGTGGALGAATPAADRSAAASWLGSTGACCCASSCATGSAVDGCGGSGGIGPPFMPSEVGDEVECVAVAAAAGGPSVAAKALSAPAGMAGVAVLAMPVLAVAGTLMFSTSTRKTLQSPRYRCAVASVRCSTVGATRTPMARARRSSTLTLIFCATLMFRNCAGGVHQAGMGRLT